MFKLAITGRFRRGKDTLAQELLSVLYVKRAEQSVVELAFAHALKDELSSMLRHWMLSTPEPDPHPLRVSPRPTRMSPDVRAASIPRWHGWMREQRDLNGVGWQWYGELCRQLYGEDYWIKHPQFQYEYSQAILQNKSVIITDMRHHNEAVWCKAQSFTRVRIVGPCRAEGETRDTNHPSERFVDDLDVDLVFENTGTTAKMHVWIQQVLIPRLAQLPE